MGGVGVSTRQERRDAAARDRGFASYYHERTSRARALGYAHGYAEQRKARAGLAPLARGDRPGRVSQPPRDRTSTASGMRVLASRDARFLARELRKLGDTPVIVRLTVSGGTKDERTRTIEVGGAKASGVEALGVQALLAGIEWSHVSGKVQVIIGRGGVLASALLPQRPEADSSGGGSGGWADVVDVGEAPEDFAVYADGRDEDDLWDLIMDYLAGIRS